MIVTENKLIVFVIQNYAQYVGETAGEKARLFELEFIGNGSHDPPDEEGGFYPSSDWVYPTEKHSYDCLCCGLPV